MIAKPKMMSIAVIACLLLSQSIAHAEEANPKPKSGTLAAVLALDPLPADALFYAGKDGQGIINLALGGLGGMLFWIGLIKHLHTERGDWEDLGNLYAMTVGGVLYFPALLWDAFGGIIGVSKHNEKIKNEKSSFLKTIRPIVSIVPEHAFVGAQVRF